MTSQPRTRHLYGFVKDPTKRVPQHNTDETAHDPLVPTVGRWIVEPTSGTIKSVRPDGSYQLVAMAMKGTPEARANAQVLGTSKLMYQGLRAIAHGDRSMRRFLRALGYQADDIAAMTEIELCRSISNILTGWASI